MPPGPGSTSPQWTEPLVLIDGGGPDDRTAAEPERRGERWRRRSRTYVDLGLLVVLVATVVLLTRDREPPEPVSATAGSTTQEQPARNPYPLLIAPASVRPGEVVSMVAYRRQDLCGVIELRLDGVRLEHRVTATIEESRLGWSSVVLSVVIPAASLRGDHELELFGPLPGAGRGGVRCGDHDQRQARVATTSLVVSARRE